MNVRLVHKSTATSDLNPMKQRKSKMMDALRGLLAASCRLRNEGAAYAKLAHAQGYADGYSRVLLDGGIVSQAELLGLVLEVRRGVNGPATQTMSPQLAVSA